MNMEHIAGSTPLSTPGSTPNTSPAPSPRGTLGPIELPIGPIPMSQAWTSSTAGTSAPALSTKEGAGTTTASSHPPLPKRKKIANPSDVWNHYTRLEVVDQDRPQCKCNYCGSLFGCHHRRNGISGLKQHLNSCIMYKRKNSQADIRQSFLSHDIKSAKSNTVCDLGVVRFDEKRIRRKIARMIILDECPFRIVEKDGFVELIHDLEPRFKMPSRSIIARDCMGLYLEERTALKACMRNNSFRCCFTTDTWTSIQNMNYMCVTAHFIDSDWKLQKRILSFRRVSDHKRTTIARELEECMVEWGIDKILTITMDNASANDSAVEQLKRRKLSATPVVPRKIVCGHEFIHMRCCAHILNLILGDGLKEVDNSIVKILNLVKYVKSSPSRLDIFKGCVKRCNMQCSAFLTLDVPTRWNSTYMMLDVAEKYQPAFEFMLEDDGHLISFLCEDGHGRRGLGPPTLDDWDHVRHFTKFLKLFYEVTLRWSVSNTSTANIYFEELARVHKHLVTYCDSGDLLLEEMAQRMKLKFDKYWGDVTKVNKLLFVATVLDPRFKLFTLEFWFKRVLGVEKGVEMTRVLRATIDRLYLEYSINSGLSDVGMSTDNPNNIDLDQNRSTNDMWLWEDLDEERATQSVLDHKSEVDRYLLEKEEARISPFDILNWWNVNSTKFPILSCISRDVLAIPVTTVPSESLFSTSSRVLDAFRSSLAPKTIESLICAQNWLRSAPKMDVDYDELNTTEDPMTYTLDAEVDTRKRPAMTITLN